MNDYVQDQETKALIDTDGKKIILVKAKNSDQATTKNVALKKAVVAKKLKTAAYTKSTKDLIRASDLLELPISIDEEEKAEEEGTESKSDIIKKEFLETKKKSTTKKIDN